MTTLAQPQNSHKPATFHDGLAAGIHGAALEEMTSPEEREGWWETKRPLLPAMNSDAVKIESGRLSDKSVAGELHRAIMVARELVKAGMWNGQDLITIYNPSVTFDKLFGFQDVPVTMLRSGVDYLIVEPVMPYSKPELKVEEDGDILYA